MSSQNILDMVLLKRDDTLSGVAVKNDVNLSHYCIHTCR